MAAFKYIALNKAGKRVKGVCQADSLQQARQQLRAQGLFPEELTAATAGKRAGKRGPRLKTAELSIITRQLATLISAGIPLDEALQGVASQQEKQSMRAIVLGVRAQVMEGQSLALALAVFPRAFPHLFRVTIAAGEQSGKLGEILNRLADYVEQQQQMRRSISQALIYPIMMLVVSLGVMVFLLSDVVPRIVSVFTDNQQALPGATVFLLAVSGFIRHQGLWLFLGIVVLSVFFRAWLKSEKNRARWHKTLLRLPVIGPIMLTINAARFARTLGILSRAGVPMLNAMQAAAELISPLPMRYAVIEATSKVREGQPIHRSLEKTGYFSPLFIHLLASGEASGNLEDLLQRVADQQDSDVESKLKTMLTLFEPLIILIMGGMVLFIVLAVLLPIFNMDQMVG